MSVKDNIHIYDLNNMKLLNSIDSKNFGVCRIVLAPNFNTNCFLCYSDSITDGKVSVYDCNEMVPYKPIEAHTSPVLKLSINPLGNKLCTASCKGTVIRVWKLPSGELLHSFHRGIHNVYIHSLTFSIESNYVICSTSKGSLHVFQMEQEREENQTYETKRKDVGCISSLINCVVGGVLPLDYIEYKTSEKATASIFNEKCKM